jgi:hypothetical protein
MANTSAMKRGFHYDEANTKLSIYVNGTEVVNYTTTAINYPTTSAMLNIGTSASPVAYTAGTPAFAMYTTNAGTSGSTSAEPFYVKSTLTGAGQVGGRARFHTYSNVAGGGWTNALKSYLEFGDSGTVTGLASSMCVEMLMPNANMGSGGAYYPLEIEYVAGGTSLVTAGSATGNQAGFIYMAQSGDADGDFDDHGFLFYLAGCTAGSGHLYDTTASAATGDATLKINVGGATKYLLIADDAS